MGGAGGMGGQAGGWGPLSSSDFSSPGALYGEDEMLTRAVENATAIIRRLHDLAEISETEEADGGREGKPDKGKRREDGRKDEVWDGLSRLGNLFKRSVELKLAINVDFVIAT